MNELGLQYKCSITIQHNFQLIITNTKIVKLSGKILVTDILSINSTQTLQNNNHTIQHKIAANWFSLIQFCSDNPDALLNQITKWQTKQNGQQAWLWSVTQ